MNTRRRKAKVPLEDKETLLRNINMEYENKLVDFAKYFANAKNAEVAVIKDVDSEGLDLTCKDRLKKNFEASENGLREREVRITWYKPITSNHDVISQMKLLDSEVKMAQKMNDIVDKNYVPPGREKKMIIFENPSLEEYLFVSLYWIAIFIVSQPALIPKSLYDLIISIFGTYDAIYNIIFAIACVNGALAFATFYTCLSAAFPLIVAVKWTALTFFFGFMTAGKAMKIAFKRKHQLAAEDDIG